MPNLNKGTKIGQFGIIAVGLLTLQACTQTQSLNLQGTENYAFRADQMKLQQGSAVAQVNAGLELQRKEFLNWQQIWLKKLDRLEEDRKAFLADKNSAPEVVKPVVIEPKITKTAVTAKAKLKKSVKSAGAKYDKLIAKYAGANGVPIKLAHAVVRVESSYRANARGGVGEIGLMQVRLSTARGMGYRGSAKGLYHPETNIKYGMKYLGKAFKLGGGSTCGAILKYNAGHGAKRMNPTSAKYCKRVKAYI